MRHKRIVQLVRFVAALFVVRVLWPLFRWLYQQRQLLLSSGDVPLGADPERIGSFSDLKLLSRATCGTIYLARSTHSGDTVAIKRTKVDEAKADIKHQAQFEVEVMQKIKSAGGHPNVLDLIDHIYTDNSHLNVVLAYCGGGDLLTKLEEEPDERFSEYASSLYFKEMLQGLQFLHKHLICHRDLSLENLLLTDTGRVKICDFGLSAYYEHAGLTTTVGKLFYLPPELYTRKPKYDGFCADIWSAGICLFIMLTGAPPAERPSMSDPGFCCLKEGMLPDILKAWGMEEVLSGHAVELLTIILRVRPDVRCSIESMMAHAWLQGQNTADKRLQLLASMRTKHKTRRTQSMWSADALSPKKRIVDMDFRKWHAPKPRLKQITANRFTKIKQKDLVALFDEA